MNWENLKSAISEVVKTNNNQEITGQNLQEVLIGMVTALGEHSTFGGVADVSTAPGIPDGPVFYFVTEPGNYANFGLTNGEHEFSMFSQDGRGTWVKKVIITSYDMADIDVLLARKADTATVAQQILSLQENKADKNNVYTKPEVDTMLDPLASKSYVDAAALTKADKADVQTLQGTVAGLQRDKADKNDTYTKTEVDNLIGEAASKDDVYTKPEVDTMLDPLASKSYVDAAALTKADKADVQTLQGTVAGLQRDKADKTVVSEEADGLCPQLPDDADKANKFLGGDGQWKIVKSSSFDYIIDSNTTSEEVRDILSQDNVRVLVKNVQSSYSGEVTLGNDVYVEGEGPHLSTLGFNRINVRCQEGKAYRHATFNNLYVYSWLNIENSLDVSGNVYLEFTNCYIAKRTDNNHNTIYANDLNAANEPNTRVDLKFTGCTLKNSDVDGRAIYLNNIKYSTVTFIGCQVAAPQTPVLISNPNFSGGTFEAYSTAFIFPLDGTNRIVTGDAVNSIVTENCSPDVGAKHEVFRVDDFPQADDYEQGDVVLIARPEIDYTRSENMWMLGYPQGHHFKLVSGIFREILIHDTSGPTGEIIVYTDAIELPDISGFIRLYGMNHDYFGILKYNPDRVDGQIFRRDGWFTDCGRVEFLGIHEADVPVWYDVTPIDNDTIIENPVRYIETVPEVADYSMGSVLVYKPVTTTTSSQAGWLHGHTYKKMIVACKKVTLVVGGNTSTRYVLDDIRADSPIRMFTFDTGDFFYDGYLLLNADLTSGVLFSGNNNAVPFTDFTDTGTTEQGENFLDITPRKSDGEFVIEGNNGLTLPKPQRTWTGTYGEWQALSGAEKAKYEGGVVNITDDEVETPEYYSTEEVKTNKVWIDGKPIYRRVFEIYKNGVLNGWTRYSVSEQASFTYTAGLDFIDTLISNVCLTSNGIITSWSNGTTNVSYAMGIRRSGTSTFAIINGSGGGFTGTVATLILEYTKTTD